MTTFDLVEAKSEWSLDPEVHHLNHGSYGALPRVVYAEQKKWQEEVHKNPVGFYARLSRPAVADARAKIAKFLGQEAMIGQYAHGNEPSHHIGYLYAYSTEPQTGQKYIHRVINEFHGNTPNGMIGNDDCGQMSAWYILSTLGFYPVNPASGEFVLGSPQVKKATLHLAKNKSFSIEAKNFSEQAIYNETRLLNGKEINKPFITFQDVINGGSLIFEMIIGS